MEQTNPETRNNPPPKHTGEEMERMRMQAVTRVSAGESPETVIRSLGLSRSCIYKWLAKFRKGGASALRAKSLSGRPAKVEAEQIRWLRGALLQPNPPANEAIGFSGLWTREMIRQLLFRRYGLVLSRVSVSRLLIKMGLVFHRNVAPAKNQMDLESARIKTMAMKARAEIFRCTHETMAQKNGGSLCQISTVNGRGEEYFMLAEGGLGDAVMEAFLDRLCSGRRRPAYLIVDDLPVYRSAAVRKKIMGFGQLLSVFYLPMRQAPAAARDLASCGTSLAFKGSKAPEGILEPKADLSKH